MTVDSRYLANHLTFPQVYGSPDVSSATCCPACALCAGLVMPVCVQCSESGGVTSHSSWRHYIHRHVSGSLATRLTWCHGTSVTAAWQMWRSPWPRDERGQNFGDGSFAALVTSNKCQRWLGLLGGLLGLGREFLSLTHRYVSHLASGQCGDMYHVWGLNRGMNADDGNRQNIEIEVSQSTSAIIAVADSSVRFKFLV